jgi:PAS domain-containing protein
VVGKATAAIFHVVNEVVKRSQEQELGELVEPGFEVHFFIKARKFGIADTHEWTYLRKDGTTFPILLSITAIKNSAGEITGYLG